MDLSIFVDGRFYLLEIGEPADNRLRLVVAQTQTGAPVRNEHFDSVSPIEISRSAEAIELLWGDYIAYAVLNESFATADPDGPPESMLRCRANTAFLDYVARDTFATDDYPGPFDHWELICLNHVVHVASRTAPEIRRVPLEEQWLDRDGPRNFQR